MSNITKEQTWLPEGFTPGAHDVVIGRGRVCYSHIGNKHLGNIVKSMLGPYSAADSKKVKSEIIFEIVVRVREMSPGGGFVKLDKSSSKYFEVGTHIAREKVSQAFRDALADKYKSSTSAKAFRRKQERRFRRGDHSKPTGKTLNMNYAENPAGLAAALRLPQVTQSQTKPPALNFAKLHRPSGLDSLLAPTQWLDQRIHLSATRDYTDTMFLPFASSLMAVALVNHEHLGRGERFQQACQYY